MDEWLEQVAGALQIEPLGRSETGEILKVSREVAHRVERMYAPLASFLLGAATERARAAGAAPEEAFAVAVERLRALLPPEDESSA